MLIIADWLPPGQQNQPEKNRKISAQNGFPAHFGPNHIFQAFFAS